MGRAGPSPVRRNVFPGRLAAAGFGEAGLRFPRLLHLFRRHCGLVRLVAPELGAEYARGVCNRLSGRGEKSGRRVVEKALLRLQQVMRMPGRLSHSGVRKVLLRAGV